MLRSRCRNAVLANRSGAAKHDRRACPLRICVERASGCPRPDASITAGWPRSVSRAHWSRISAISGDTTTVRSVARERGQLVAEALAAAGGHDDERVAAVERGLDRLALAGPEGREAEQGEQRLGGGVREPRAGGEGGRRRGRPAAAPASRAAGAARAACDAVGCDAALACARVRGGHAGRGELRQSGSARRVPRRRGRAGGRAGRPARPRWRRALRRRRRAARRVVHVTPATGRRRAQPRRDHSASSGVARRPRVRPSSRPGRPVGRGLRRARRRASPAASAPSRSSGGELAPAGRGARRAPGRR